MTRTEFLNLLDLASSTAIKFARRYVTNSLPEPARYHVELNQSYDGHALPDERVYPADDGRHHPSLSREEVADLLLRDGRCPEWIDINVEAVCGERTLLKLICCGRYSDDPRRWYYTARGTGPFGVKSPVLPVGYRDGDRFELPRL